MAHEDDNSLIFIRKYLLGPYFYQGWFEFEPEPFEIGYIDGKESGILSVERKFATLNSLLTLPVAEAQFVTLAKRLGVNYREVPGTPTIREILTEVQAGLLKALTEKTLKLVNDSGELS